MPLQQIELQPATQVPLNLEKEQTEDGSAVSSSPRSPPGESGYLSLLEKLHSTWKDCPAITITYKDLAYIVQIPVVEQNIRNFLLQGVDKIRRLNPFSRRKMMDFVALAPTTGMIRAGTNTLILAPPGHGKSTFLKALAGRLTNDKHLRGEIRYDGLTYKQAMEKNIHVKRLTTYVGQQDMHFPVLTVKETMNFVVDSAVSDASLLGDDELTTLSKRRAELAIQLLGLDECQDTIIGNDLLRGISGGQRRRVTLGEMLVTNARVMLLDEVSTGLDSAVTYHIFNALKSWTRITHGSIVTALLQPTPETYRLFDDVILMREGVIVYHGPRTQVKEWFETSVGITIPSDADEAGWIVDYLTDPTMLLKQMARDAKLQAKRASLTNNNQISPPAIVPATASEHEESATEVVFHDLDENDTTSTAIHEEKINPHVQSISTHQLPRDDVAVTTEELLERYQSSTQYADVTYTREQHQQQMSSDSAYQLDRSHWSPYTISQYGQPLPHSYAHHLKLCMGRQRMLTARNTSVIRPRVFQSVFLGFVYGTLFTQLPVEDYSSKLGLILILIMTGAFANLSELPTAAEARNVVTKQIDAGFVPPVAYVTSVQIWAVPLNLVEVAVYGTMMYWIPGFAPNAGRYFFWLLIMFSSSVSLSTFFRTISYVASNPDVARQMDLPFIIIFVIFGGFLIPYGKVPRWLIWLFWSSPLSWAFRSLALNEFKDSRYDTIQNGIRIGDVHLNAFDIDTNNELKWAGVGYLWGFAILFIFVSSYALANWRGVVSLGTKRTPSDSKKSKLNKLASEDTFRITIAPQVDKVVDKAIINTLGSGQAAIGALGNNDRDRVGMNNPQNDVQQIVKTGEERQQENMGGKDFFGEQLNASVIPSGSFQLAGLPFTPAVLSWKDLKYTVRVGKGKDAHDRVLLQSISGFAAPYTLTALMGASGAGKTTLMDVIAGRKTTGKVEGEIFVNGKPKETHSFNHLTGYVEQQDLHMGLHTVREALLFSAKLRLPTSVSDQDQHDWVDQVMMLVGLTKLAHRLIGDASTPSLSPGQLKLVTIGVEMVANPAILFLDEPTSGLDAPSAFRVMKAVRRISQTGRSVVCTIHQPSAELFYMFNRLLLLRPGGECVYFSDIGEHGEQLVSYFNEVAGPEHPLPPLKHGQNPANWMLDVVGAGSSNPEGGPGSSDASFPALDYAALWKQSNLYKQTQADTEKAYQARPLELGDQKYVNRWTRYWEVQKRYYIMHWRNGPTNLTRCILQLIMGIFCGLIYLQLGRHDFQGLNSFLSVIFLGIAFPASISSASSLPSFFRQRAVYYRESTVGMYGYLSYSTAITLVEIPFIFFSLIWFVVPFYFMIGFENDVNLFFKFYLVVFVQALVYSFLSQLWMAMLPSPIAANILNGLFMSLFFMFGGLFIKASKIPAGWKWFYYIDPIPKTFIAASLPQLYCDSVSNPNCPKVEVPGQGEKEYIYEYISSQIEGAESEYWPMIGWLLLTMGVIRILNLLFLRFVSHIKR